jgi:hypothetical protein
MDRSTTKSGLLGPLLFVSSRLADPFVQNYLLTSGTAANILKNVGIAGIHAGAVFSLPGLGGASMSQSVFSIGRLNGTAGLVVGMIGAASLKHVCTYSLAKACSYAYFGY